MVGGVTITPVQVMAEVLEVSVMPAESTKEARTMSVPATALVYVNIACPAALAGMVLINPAFGPLITIKVMGVPAGTGLVSLVAVAVRVSGVPTGLESDVGASVMPCPTTAVADFRKNPAKKMLSSFEGFWV